MIDNKVEDVKKHVSAIMDILGIERNPSNENTDLRIAKMYCNELFKNRNNANLEELNSRMKVFPNEGTVTPITVSEIEFNSTCFVGKTPVRMKDGVKYIRDVKIGDTAITFNGNGDIVEKPVTHVFKRKVRNTLMVNTANGKKLRCTPDHPFYVENVGWVDAENLVAGDVLRVLNKGKDYGKASVWDYTVNENQDYGYLLGALASDGSTWRNQIRLEVNDEQFAKKVALCFKSVFNIETEVTESEYSSGFTPGKYPCRYLVRVISGYLVDYLKKVFGGSTNSQEFLFPEIVLNDYNVFIGFVRGYFEGDGTYNSHSGAKLITSNIKFAERITEIFNTSYYPCSGDNSCVSIVVPLHLLDLNKRDKYKQDYDNMWKIHFKNKNRIVIKPLMRHTTIISVEDLPPHEVTVYNFEVEDNHTYLASDIWVHNCEHHWLPFMGLVSVTYIPDETIIGLSKIPRVVKYFSKRPQLQERLTNDIGDYLVSILKPKYLKVELIATHTCVMCRGAESKCKTSTIFEFGGDIK